MPAAPRPKRVPAHLVALACLTLAMLIWVKLRVVTGVPRTAYADPEAKTPAQPPAESPKAEPGKQVGSAESESDMN